MFFFSSLRVHFVRYFKRSLSVDLLTFSCRRRISFTLSNCCISKYTHSFAAISYASISHMIACLFHIYYIQMQFHSEIKYIQNNRFGALDRNIHFSWMAISASCKMEICRMFKWNCNICLLIFLLYEKYIRTYCIFSVLFWIERRKILVSIESIFPRKENKYSNYFLAKAASSLYRVLNRHC